jgi:hypothetical protein
LVEQNNKKARVIAYYLPQFHQIPENDSWWGPGFTEWTNVRKAVPLFPGHYQPHIPSTLGYYNLLSEDTREKQAEMAKEVGIEGFCYWHYWFGNGKQLLEKPFNEVLRRKKPDFPFCLGWANESWMAKIWNNGHYKRGKILIEQKYFGKEDDESHFYHLLDAFRDERYIRVDGKPLFLIYRPYDIINVQSFIDRWNKLAVQNGIGSGFYFIGQILNISEKKELENRGFNAVTCAPRFGYSYGRKSYLFKLIKKAYRIIRKRPNIEKYSKAVNMFVIDVEDSIENVFPTLIPNWDHTPRSGLNGFLLTGSTPDLFKINIERALDVVKNKEDEHKIIFLKSWNEWGEGNYIEPDQKFGDAYLKMLKRYLL